MLSIKGTSSILLFCVTVSIIVQSVHSATPAPPVTNAPPATNAPQVTNAPSGGSTVAGGTQATTPFACEDLVLNCKSAISQCRSSKKFKKLLKENCARSCGFCKSDDCSDIDQDTCQQWNKSGFCESPFYKAKLKEEKCRRTCRLCN